jgi:hypothetical protein
MSFGNQESKSGYAPLDNESLASLRRFLCENGENVAARHFGLNKQTLARAAVGLDIQHGSAVVIRQGLCEVA